MAFFDFPNSPTIGQTVSNGGILYQWDGVKWVAAGGGGGAGGAFLPLTGGTLTGALTMGSNNIVFIGGTNTWNAAAVSNNEFGLYNTMAGNWALVLDSASNLVIEGNISSVTGNLKLYGGGTEWTLSAVTNGEFGLFNPVTSNYSLVVDQADDVVVGRNLQVDGGAVVLPGGGTEWSLIAVSNGEFGIFNSTANDYTLVQDQPGNLVITGLLTEGSDPRLKKAVTAAPGGALAKVATLPVKTFRWNHEPDTGPLHYGFLSTDVHRVMGPSFGGWSQAKTEKKTEGLAYSEMTSVLWQGVQELLARVEALEGTRPAPGRRS